MSARDTKLIWLVLAPEVFKVGWEDKHINKYL